MIKKEKVGTYLRLSKDDVVNRNGESNSIKNQREIISNFIVKNNFEIFNEYVDDGFSGLNFNRPSFCRLINDLEKNKFKIIIVKDLSRFGRDYIVVGKYLQQIFPKMNVRFISIIDGYDSFTSEFNNFSLFLPIKNLLNENYLSDLSNKIKSVQMAKKKNGECLYPFAPYGYKKDPNNKYKLIIDEEVEDVIKIIFKLKIEGYNSQEIARNLNIRNVLTPYEYKKITGVKFNTTFANSNSGKKLWSTKLINRIIKNRVYIGYLEQNKKVKLNYKSISKSVERDKWIITKNAHEAIITKTDFDVANKLMLRDLHKIKNNNSHILAGLLFCADCKKQMLKRDRIKATNFVCSSYVYTRKSCCSSHRITENDLYANILDTIKKEIEKHENLIEKIKNSNKDLNKMLDKLKNSYKEELEKCRHICNNLGEYIKIKVIDKDDFVIFKRFYDEKIKNLEKNLKEEEILFEELRASGFAFSNLVKFKNSDFLKDRLKLVYSIDKIEVLENSNIKIIFNDQPKIDIINKILEEEYYAKNS